MDYNNLYLAMQDRLGSPLLNILGAILILVIGWLIAVLVRAGVRRGLAALGVNRRITESTEQRLNVESTVAAGAFWVVILITLIGVFNSLNLPLISEPFQRLADRILGYLPSLIAGAVLVLVAWLVATLLRALVNKVLGATRLDERLSAHADMQPMSQTAGNVVYWLVFLLFLPAILSAFEIEGLLDPVRLMIAKVLDMLPNIVAATIIGFAGWLVGRVLSGLTTNLLAAAGADRVSTRVGLDPTVSLSRLAGTLVFILVFVPALIAALDALQIDSISRPATDMLDRILLAVPNIIAAAIILVLTWYVAKFAAQLLARLLTGLGVDTLPARMGLTQVFSGTWLPSRLVGGLLVYFAMLFATVEAAHRLDFERVAVLVSLFIQFSADILLGGVILAVGFWLATLAGRAIERTGAAGLAFVARVAIIGLVLAMGLRAMGIADDIVNLAFALTLGAVAVAVALSFGLGGREAAGRQMEYWLARLRGRDQP